MAADPLTKNTVDDLFDFDFESDDPFGEKTTSKPRGDKPTLSPRVAKRRADADDADGFGLDLGLDQEVKIKKRKPNPKLDEALYGSFRSNTLVHLLTTCRLLSKHGIPKLRALVKDGIPKKLRLKGKGHEFSDAAKLLNYFQLWLDDLYPRAKFADGLHMVEKVGHSKRMQVMRREWINESKHKELYGDEDMYGGQTDGAHTTLPQNTPGAKDGGERPIVVDDDGHEDDLFFPDAGKKPEARTSNEPDDDELDALLAEHTTTTLPKPQQKAMTEDSEGEDDLDALFAEAERPSTITPPREDEAEDDDDPNTLLGKPISHKEDEPATGIEEDVEDDLDALLAEHETRPPAAPTPKETIFDEDEDELDALMAE
jgi:replication fork protection complex subunit Csm3/Swi3